MAGHEKWLPLPETSGRRAQNDTLLGPFLALSGFVEDCVCVGVCVGERSCVYLCAHPFPIPQHAVSEQYRSQTLTEDQGKVLGSNLAQTISLARVGRTFTANPNHSCSRSQLMIPAISPSG